MNNRKQIIKFIISLCLSLLSILAINSCQTNNRNQPPKIFSDNNIRIGISSENLILEPDIKFLVQKATKKNVEIVTKGSVSLTELACKGELDAIAIADEMWPNIKCPDAGWVDTSGSLYQTRIQFALPTTTAQQLGWDNRVVSRQEVLTALQSGKLNLATTIPTYSNSGYNTLLWLAREAISSNLAPEQITPEALAPLQPIYQNLAQKSESTAYLAQKLSEQWQPNTLAALYRFLYSPDGKALYYRGQKLPLAEPVTFIEVTPAVTVTPTWFVTIKDEQLRQQLIERVFNQLESKNPNTFARLRQLNPPTEANVTKEATPVAEVHRRLLDSFHPSIRQKRWIIGIIDASASMQGEGYSQLLAAFEQLLLPELAKANFLYSPSDRFNLVVYQGNRAYSIPDNLETANNPQVRESLYSSLKNKVKPSGGTPVDLGLLEGFKTALEIPDEFQLEVFLFTDGQFSNPVDTELLELHRQLEQRNAELTIVGAGDVRDRQLITLADELNARPIVSQDANQTLDELLKAFREAQI